MEWRGSIKWVPVYFWNGTQRSIHCVKLSDILLETGLKSKSKWVLAEGSDSGMTRSIPIEKILDDCIVAPAMNGSVKT